jgi:hypothetical protein
MIRTRRSQQRQLLLRGQLVAARQPTAKGVVTDQTQTYTSGTAVGPANDMTRKTTETTVTR